MKVACLIAMVVVVLVGLAGICQPDSARMSWDDAVKARPTQYP